MSLRRLPGLLVAAFSLGVLMCLIGFMINALLRRETAAVSIPQPLIVEITGQDYGWSVRYPGPDGVQGTADDFVVAQVVTLAAGIPTKLVLKSKDFLYGFELPDFGLTEIAVPDLVFALEFTPEAEGAFRVRGHQMCNYTHAQLMSTLKVCTPAAFALWTRKHSRDAT